MKIVSDVFWGVVDKRTRKQKEAREQQNKYAWWWWWWCVGCCLVLLVVDFEEIVAEEENYNVVCFLCLAVLFCLVSLPVVGRSRSSADLGRWMMMTMHPRLVLAIYYGWTWLRRYDVVAFFSNSLLLLCMFAFFLFGWCVVQVFFPLHSLPRMTDYQFSFNVTLAH